MFAKTLAVLVLMTAAATAQNVEIGAAVGNGMYHNGTIVSTAGTADAGIGNAIMPSIVACDNMYEHVSGEFRYSYQAGSPFLTSGSTKVEMTGKTHTFTYDVLIHLRGRQSRLRPYFAAGAGIRGYMGGPAPTTEPLSKIGLLLANNEWKLVGSVGGGVKFRVQKHVVLRFDLRDYITPFPKKQIYAASGATAPGLLQQITPMGGVGFEF